LNHACWVGRGSRAGALVWSWDRSVQAAEAVGEAQAATVEALQGAQERVDDLEARHAEELARVQQEAAQRVSEAAGQAAARAWAQALGLRLLGWR
jgi:hypothetical protein